MNVKDKDYIEDKDSKDREIVVATMRCIDMASPVNDVDKVPCTECGEITWLSHDFRGQKIDKIVCLRCFESKHSKDEYVALAKERSIENAIDILNSQGVTTTKEELIKVVERKLGKKIYIVR